MLEGGGGGAAFQARCSFMQWSGEIGAMMRPCHGNLRSRSGIRNFTAGGFNCTIASELKCQEISGDEVGENPKRVSLSKGKEFKAIRLKGDIPAQSRSLTEKTERTPEEQAEVERLRRERISIANRGKLPWNAGKKHRAETIKLIKERTRLAMEDPKVRERLRGFQQKLPEAVKAKISFAVHQRWVEKLKVLGIQKQCLTEWKECIGEAARQGGPGEEELQWDSYETLQQELTEEYKKQRRGARSKVRKGSYSEEHRRNISEAIKAKWTSEEYRGKVLEGMVSTPKRTRKPKEPKEPKQPKEPKEPKQPKDPKRRRVKTVSERKSHTDTDEEGAKDRVPNKAVKLNGVSHSKLSSATGSSLPAFVDLEATEKMEKLRQLRASRTLVEMKKREAAERARMLMAEAEKAAKALEAVATKDQVAMAALLETRRLLADAAKSIEAVESSIRFNSVMEPSELWTPAILEQKLEAESTQLAEAAAVKGSATSTSEDEDNQVDPDVDDDYEDDDDAGDETAANTVATTTTARAARPKLKSSSGEIFDLTDCWTDEQLKAQTSIVSTAEAALKPKSRKRWHRGRLVTVADDYEVDDEEGKQ